MGFSKCSPSRGPTNCKLGTCYCKTGYCRYPPSTLHIQSRYCVARVPGATCHASRFCWSGGFSTSFCSSGLCMCKWGLYPEKQADGKYLCVTAASELAIAMAGNATQAEIEDLLEFQEDSDRTVAYNMLTAGLWVSVVLVTGIGVMFYVMRKRSRRVDDIDFNMLLG